MAPTEYTLVFQETSVEVDGHDPTSEVITMAMRADSPVLRYLRPNLIYEWPVYDLSGGDPDYMFEFHMDIMATMSTLQAAALLEIDAAYSAAIVDVGRIPRGTAVIFTQEELHTSTFHAYTECKFAHLIAGWTDERLMDVIRDFGCSKKIESTLEGYGRSRDDAMPRKRFVYNADDMSRIRREVAAYDLQRKTSAINALVAKTDASGS